MTIEFEAKKIFEKASLHEMKISDGFLVHVAPSMNEDVKIAEKILSRAYNLLIFKAIKNGEKIIFLSQNQEAEIMGQYYQRNPFVNSMAAFIRDWDKQFNIKTISGFFKQKNIDFNKLSKEIGLQKTEKIFAFLPDTDMGEDEYKDLLKQFKIISSETKVKIFLFQLQSKYASIAEEIANYAIDTDCEFSVRVRKEKINPENEFGKAIIDCYAVDLMTTERFNADLIEINKNTKGIAVLIKCSQDMDLLEVSSILEEIDKKTKEELSTEVKIIFGTQIYEEISEQERTIEITTFNNEEILERLPLGINMA